MSYAEFKDAPRVVVEINPITQGMWKSILSLDSDAELEILVCTDAAFEVIEQIQNDIVRTMHTAISKPLPHNHDELAELFGTAMSRMKILLRDLGSGQIATGTRPPTRRNAK